MSKELNDDFTIEKVTLCSDGKYRWMYKFDMLKNPVILLTTWKVIGMAFFIVFIIANAIGLIGGDLDPKAVLGTAKALLIVTLVLCFIGIFAYLYIAKLYGWRYLVVFEMDENGITHRQMKSQFDKAKATLTFIALVGAAAGSLSAAAAGINAATRDSLSTDFAKVKKVKLSKYHNTIYVNAPFSHNQIYVAKEDLDFVLDYILARVPEKAAAKVRR